jgi:general secretion pathway protein B
MSYILDALKKAESERHLGSVPTLHTPAEPALSGKHTLPWPSWPKLLTGLALVAILLMLAALLWRASWDAAPPPGSPASATLAPTQPAAQPQPQATSKVRQTPIKRAAPVAAAPSRAPATAVTPPPSIAPAPAKALVPTSTTTPTPKREPTAPPPTASEAIAPLLPQLPEAIQRAIPPLAIKGIIYSTNPADRILLVGNGLLHEGEDLPGGVRLERILPKSAILNYKGLRYRVAY